MVPLLLMVVFGAFDFARAFQSSNEIGNAAREGAREGAVNSSVPAIGARVARSLEAPTASVGVVELGAVGAACNAVAGKEYTVCVTCRTDVNAYSICPAPPAAALSNGTVRVQIRHTYKWVTPVGAIMKMFGNGLGSGASLTEVVEMRIE